MYYSINIQYMYNIWKIYNSFALAAKQNRYARQMLAFLPVSETRANQLYIFRQCTYIVYILVSIQNICNLSMHIDY
jgi:hypothetical protein